MHCHSTASELAKLGIQRSLGLPECATPPEEAYALAKRRGMDFFTLTDHDTIDGCLELAGRPDVFISEELTAWFAGEPQAVHVLCYGITPEDHEFLQSHAFDLETCAAYLKEHGITCALAHPFFEVAAPLDARHRRRLAQLFGVWEVRNGSRARELNMPSAVYVETHGGTGIGGSDDHAGVDIGRTWTETPPASFPEEFLGHVREGLAVADGAQGSAAKWAHSALALATRALLRENDELPEAACSPATVLEIAQRVVGDGALRGGDATPGLDAGEVTALVRAWLDSTGLPRDPRKLIELMQEDGFSHSDLHRKARRAHERKLREAIGEVQRVAETGKGYAEAALPLFDAMIPALPYVPAMAILGAEKRKLSSREGEPKRVALVVDAIGSMHGVSHTVERLREHGVPGYEVEVIGTDSRVDRRLPAVAEVDVPHYPGLNIGIPSIPELAETIADGAYDAIHVTAPGPAGIAAALMARIAGLPLVGEPSHGARGLCATAFWRSRPGSRYARRPVPLLLGVPAGALTQQGGRRVDRLARHPGRQDPPLGAWGGPGPLQPRQGEPQRLSGPVQGSLRRAPLEGEGGGSPGRCLRDRARAGSAAPSPARRGRARGGRAQVAARRRGHLPWLARS